MAHLLDVCRVWLPGDMTDWFDDDAAFKRVLGRAWTTELRLALALLRQGLWVRVEPFRFRERVEDYPQFTEGSDLEAAGGHRIEVKSRAIRFTSPEDFPYATAFVGSRRRWDERRDSPCSIVLYSEPTEGYVVVPITSRPDWVLDYRYDPVHGRDETSYACPREHLLPFDAMIGHLRRTCSQTSLV